MAVRRACEWTLWLSHLVSKAVVLSNIMRCHSLHGLVNEACGQKDRLWLQVRHPFALAHYANHPAAGTPPNVMVAAYTFTPSPGLLPLSYYKSLLLHDTRQCSSVRWFLWFL